LQRRAQGRLGDVELALGDEIVLAALETRVGLDPHEDVQVAGHSAAYSGLALAGHAQRRPVVDARRNLHGELGLLAHPAGAAAVLAGLLDDLAFAAAFGTSLRHGEEALGELDAAAAAAALAALERRARFGAAALASVAGHGALVMQRQLRAVVRVLE